jgi:hypothetical protein
VQSNAEGFTKPEVGAEWDPPSENVNDVSSGNYLQLSGGARDYLRPGESEREFWLDGGEDAVVDFSVRLDSSELSGDVAADNYFIYAFVNYRPRPAAVTTLEQGTSPTYPSAKDMDDVPARCRTEVDFKVDAVNNYTIRIPSESFGSRGRKHLYVVWVGETERERAEPFVHSFSYGVDYFVNYGKNESTTPELPTRGVERFNWLPDVLYGPLLNLPSTDVYDWKRESTIDEYRLSRTFDVPGASTEVSSVFPNPTGYREPSQWKQIHLLLKNGEPVAETPKELEVVPTEGDFSNVDEWGTKVTTEVGVSAEGTTKVRPVRIQINRKHPTLGSKIQFGNPLFFER